MRSLFSLLVCALVGAALLLAVPATAVPSAVPGSVLPMTEWAPSLPTRAQLPSGSLDAAVRAFVRGDDGLARRELEALLSARKIWGDERLRAHFLLGWISSKAGRHQQASANFYQVRRKPDFPLHEMAMFFEARADLARGHPRTSIAECEAYEQTYAEGRYLDECQLLTADSYLALDRRKEAAERYEDFLKQHPDDARKEGIALRLARALEQNGDYERAARRYRSLYIDHQLPATGRAAAEALERLEGAGTELPPLRDYEQYSRASSLRRTGEHEASWELYDSLEKKLDEQAAAGQPSPLSATLDKERHDFLWRNRRYEELSTLRLAAWKADKTGPQAPEHLYWAIQGFARAGLFTEAAQYQREGLRRYPRHRRFRNSWERTALLHVGASEYAGAVAAMKAWASHSWRGRSSKSKFLSAYYGYRAGRLDEAIKALGKLTRLKNRFGVAARYFRGKAYERQHKRRAARVDFDQILAEHGDSWYALLIRDRRARAKRQDRPRGRDGRWVGDRRGLDLPRAAKVATPINEAMHRLTEGMMAEGGPPRLRRVARRRDADGRLPKSPRDGWSHLRLADRSEQEARMAAAPTDRIRPEEVPPTWAVSAWWDPEQGAKQWSRFVERYERFWPQLPVAWQLSRIGLGELGGPMLAEIWREIRDVRRNSPKRKQVARQRSRGGGMSPKLERWAAIFAMRIKGEQWRHIFGAAGYPASVTAFAADTIKYSQLPRSVTSNRAAWTLMYPAAFAPHVWEASWRSNVDPLLMLSIMRAESLYRHDAISSAGAIGLVQIIPPTANRVAALTQERDFRIERLTDPATNIRLGTWYLGELLRRFDGQFPLAVGAYNGGPHNIGRWLRGKTGMPFDEFVEEIAFDETRHYIKKVTGYYSIYADIYADGAPILLPERTLPDDPSVINF